MDEMEDPAADMGVPQLELPVLLWLRQPLCWLAGRCAKLRLRVRSRAHLTQHVVDVVFSRMGPEQVRHLWSVAAIPPVCCCWNLYTVSHRGTLGLSMIGSGGRSGRRFNSFQTLLLSSMIG